MKAVLSPLLVMFVFLPKLSLFAGNESHATCRAKPAFEKPAFESPQRELRSKSDVRFEKPLFEKPNFESKKISQPLIDKLAVERPLFEHQCIESAWEKNRKPTKEPTLTPFPDESDKRWGTLKGTNRRFRVIPNHQLRLRRPPIVAR